MEITTTHGLIPDALLERRDGAFENDNESTTWVEYWLPVPFPCTVEGHDITEDGMERVHRSVHVALKRGPSIFAEQGSFGA